MRKKKSSTRVWMLVPTKKDLVILVERLAAMGPLWDRWECKLRSDRILIYDPVVPWDERDNLAAATPQLHKILRIVPVQGGPFALEYMRHTGQWFPVMECPDGDINAIADYIETNRDGYFTRPTDQDLYDDEKFDAPIAQEIESAAPNSTDAQTQEDAHMAKTTVPGALQDRFEEIRAIIDTFCKAHLDAEYAQLSIDLLAVICCEGLPVQKYQATGWAAGVVSIIGRANFLSDMNSEPYMTLDDVAKKIGTSPATMHKRAKEIREVIDIAPMDPDWTVESRMAGNPLAWMIETSDGLVVDARMLPREIQAQLVEHGVIPFVHE